MISPTPGVDERVTSAGSAWTDHQMQSKTRVFPTDRVCMCTSALTRLGSLVIGAPLPNSLVDILLGTPPFPFDDDETVVEPPGLIFLTFDLTTLRPRTCRRTESKAEL